MPEQNVKQLVNSDIRAQVAALLVTEPHLSPEDAMAKIAQNLLKNNPYVPPEGDKCPINRLPDELLSQIYEAGMHIERYGIIIYQDIDDSDEEDESGDEEDEKDGNEIGVDVTNKDDGEWSDVDEEKEPRQRREHEGGVTESDDEEDDEEKSLPFQVLASHVCSRWRAIALGTPSLWADLEFEKGTSLDKHKAYIERTKTTPINIHIDCTFGDAFRDEPALQATENGNRDKELIACLKTSITYPDPTLPNLFGDPNWHLRPGLEEPLPESDSPDDHFYSLTEFSKILDLIIPHVSHWRELAVSVSDYRWIYLLLARLHQCGPADCLEIFELYHYDNDDEEDFFLPRHLAAKFLPFHGQAPCLRECAFWGVHLDWDASLDILKGLEDLELAYHTEEVRPSLTTFAAILNSSPEIRILTLCLSGPGGTEDEWREGAALPIQLPSLQDIVLRYHESQYACSLLRLFDMPNMQNLALDFDQGDYSEFVKELCKAAHGRSKSLLAGLQSLKISSLPCSRGLMDKMLEQLVNLKSLNVNCAGPEEHFFQALRKVKGTNTNAGSSSPQSPTYCPALESIVTAGITGKQMKEFVEGRSRAGAPVKKVFMSDKDEVDGASERWLRDHVKEFEYFEPSDSEEEVDEGDWTEEDDIGDIMVDIDSADEDDDDDDDDDVLW